MRYELVSPHFKPFDINWHRQNRLEIMILIRNERWTLFDAQQNVFHNLIVDADAQNAFCKIYATWNAEYISVCIIWFMFYNSKDNNWKYNNWHFHIYSMLQYE